MKSNGGTALALALTAAVSPLAAKAQSQRDGRIAFSYGESGADRPSQLAVMDADGTNERDVRGVWGVYYLSWSPDERFIAYQSGRDVGDVNVDGRPTSRRVARDAASPDWSPSGRVIAFQRLSTSSIWTVDLKTHRQRLVIRDGGSPSWSPDGERLVFVRRHDIWVLDMSTKAAHRLISHGAGHARLELPRLSPGGRWIAFERIVPGALGEEAYVYIARADGARQRLFAKGESPTWSPDGREIAYVGSSGRFADAIIRARLDGSHRRLLYGLTPYCGCGSLDWAR